jgi:hypothetical protein
MADAAAVEGRLKLVRQYLPLAWMVIEAGVAIGSGVAARSVRAEAASVAPYLPFGQSPSALVSPTSALPGSGGTRLSATPCSCCIN